METYNEFIQNILDTRGRFNCGNEYHERHHITPKCMGGKNEEENLIDLYAREHFIAHKLLADENPDNAHLSYAYGCMAWVKKDGQKRYELTPEEYEEAKIAFSKANSVIVKERMSIPENNPFYGVQRFGKDNFMYNNHMWAGKNNPRARPTVQLSKSGEFIRHWSYISEAANFLSCSVDNIVSCCAYKIPSAYGFLWMYLDEYEKHKDLPYNELIKLWKGQAYNCEKHNHRPRKVIRLCDEVIYQALALAAKENNMCNTTMTGKCKHHDGFMYYDEYLELQKQNELKGE